MRGQVLLDFTVGSTIERQIPSSQLWDLLQETGGIGDDYSSGSSVQLCGTISFKLNGHELLGPGYWLELFNLAHLAPLAADAAAAVSESAWDRHRNHAALRFTLEGATVRYTLTPNGEQIRHNRTMPMQPLIDAWTYQWFLIQRVSAEVGDSTAISKTKQRHSFFPSGYFDHVDPEAIAFVLEAPLKEVLSRPRTFG